MYNTSMKIKEIFLENNGAFECECSFKKYFIPLYFRRLVPELGRDSKATSEGIKYSNQEYTRVGYPILEYFRVQVPEKLCKASLSSFKLARKFSSKLGT